MIKFTSLLLAISGLATSATAQSSVLDGAWAMNPDSCNVTNTDLVPMRISGTTIFGYESRCELTNPVNIRGMSGQLFDLVCSGEGEEWTTRGLILLNQDGTLVYSHDGWTSILHRCD